MPFAPTQTKMRLIGRMPFAPTEEIPPAPAGFVYADRALKRPVKLIRLNPTKMLGFVPQPNLRIYFINFSFPIALNSYPR